MTRFPMFKVGLLAVAVSVSFGAPAAVEAQDAPAMPPAAEPAAPSAPAAPVARGTTTDILRAERGEPVDRKVTEESIYGPGVEKWTYSGGVIVVVQEGIVIDSFVDQQ